MTTSRSFPHHRFMTAIAFATLAASSLSGSFTEVRAADTGPAVVKYMDVDGARLPYIEEGAGEKVVLVHGAISDHRAWEPHVTEIAKSGFRAVSYSQRYFGTEPWSDKWPAFSTQLHTSDLVAFLRALNFGPFNLVAWSYSGHLLLSVALDHPDLVKSIFIYESSVPTYVTDPEALKTLQESRGATFGPVAKLLKEGDEAEATRTMIDGVANKGSGYFQQMPQAVQQMVLDNARTLKPVFAAPPARQISCADLASIKAPVAVVQGANTTPFYKVTSETAARCMPSAKHIVVPGVGHLWPGESPADFSSAVVSFLKGQVTRQ
jgi:pimeloyl-ACP methyl ester carboxylesterase